MAIQSQNSEIEKLRFGNETHEEICSKFPGYEVGSLEPNDQESVWIEQLQSYADGRKYDFGMFKLAFRGLTPFQKRVMKTCQQIPHGETKTYGELAEACGSPKGARSVGTIMKQNPIPIVVPCHRVVAAGGIGGFSAPRGVNMKRRLLALEGAAGGNSTSNENQMWLPL